MTGYGKAKINLKNKSFTIEVKSLNSKYIDTNIKLLPTFFKDLVEGFYNDEYLMTMEKIKKERGEKSDDGDKWVDKFSGYYLSSDIMLDYAEGYDKDGYKIKSREVMEEEASDKIMSSRVREAKQEYTTMVAKRTENILKTLDEKLYISTKSSIRFGFTICIACFLLFNSVSYCALVTDAVGLAVTVVDPL